MNSTTNDSHPAQIHKSQIYRIPMCKSNQTAMVMMMMMMVLRFCARICARWFVYRDSGVLSRSSVRNIYVSVAKVVCTNHKILHTCPCTYDAWSPPSLTRQAHRARGSTDKLTALTCVNNCVYACCRLLCAARILQMHTCYANIFHHLDAATAAAAAAAAAAPVRRPFDICQRQRRDTPTN